MFVCVFVYEAATHLFSNRAQDGSIVMSPVLKDTTVGGNVTHNIGDNITSLTTNVTNIKYVKIMKIEEPQKKGENLFGKKECVFTVRALL